VGKYCYVASARWRAGAWAPTGEERGGAYRGGRPPTACLFYYDIIDVVQYDKDNERKTIKGSVKQWLSGL